MTIKEAIEILDKAPFDYFTPRGSRIEYEAYQTLKDALLSSAFWLKEFEVCPNCKGCGAQVVIDSLESDTCQVCKGEGKIPKKQGE